MKLHLNILTVALYLLSLRSAFSQFSPGELSRVHVQLDGMENCLQCHETGKEISGKKCLTCHQEIKGSIDAKRGYHFKVSAQQCVACHKEHLGRDAQTIQFDKKTFDHAQTGFVRKGKHATIACEDCHATKHIKDGHVLRIISETGRQSYLGLSQACASCHEDRHNSTVGKECQNCHGTSAWVPAISFDHSKVRFKLSGRHATVACIKCHTDFNLREKGKQILFSTSGYSDCTPCHRSPHSVDFAGNQSCSSCHAEENWKTLRRSSKFNHDLTSFRLVGKHAAVQCEKCHKSGAASGPRQRLKLAHNACSDCHVDYHRGEFAGKFKSKCEQCHTPSGFRPSTFTLAGHRTSRFPLTGAHAATPCEKCHATGRDGWRRFHFSDLRCDACHKDVHNGQFVKEMREQSCAACHSTEDWFPKRFDHSKTGFALVGKHAQTRCANCHKPVKTGSVEVAQYKSTPAKCESCHKEVHQSQFAANGETNCATCHHALGWRSLIFDHNAQSAFALTGAHARIECRTCHREERSGTTSFVRYKPMSIKCESCHAQGAVGYD